MSAREASCPGCGATLTFQSAAALLVVCPYCDSASWRGDTNLELLGTVAALADLDSVLALGAVGRRGEHAWRAVGQVQLDHGAGPWNEWALALEDGSTAWVAEAQGEVLLTREAPAPAQPRRMDLKPGLKTSFGNRAWVVAEVGEGRVTTARGEIPSDLRPGATYAYADLRSTGGGFATLTYGEGEEPVLCFVGQTVDVASLGIDPESVPAREPRRVEARRISCGACGQSIDLRHPDESRRVGCPSCGTLIDVTAPEGRVLSEHKRRLKAPALPLGARARLRGLDFEVLAMLVRSVRVDGVRYPWSEYLLREQGGGYRWLVEAKGHWSLVEPVSLGDVGSGQQRRTYRGREFRHFQAGKATVDLVVGEVYWAVAVGETAEAVDWVAPPEMLTVETTEKERVASLGHYVPQAEIYAAFGSGLALPAPEGVAPHQPNPVAGAQGTWWLLGVLACSLAVALWILFSARAARQVVFAGTFAWKPAPVVPPGMAPAPAEPAVEAGGPAPAAEPNVVFSERFDIAAPKANLRVRLTTRGLSNTWVGVEGALVNEDTGEVRYFAVEAEHWSGVTEGESWSEGDETGTAWLGEVPAGRYALRLESEAQVGGSVTAWETISQPPGYRVTAQPPPVPWSIELTSQVPSTGRPLLLLLLLLLPPGLVSARAALFERTRWAESDHAP